MAAITVELIIKVSLIVLFLLYVYCMIGGYTPTPCSSYPTVNCPDKYEYYSNINQPYYAPFVSYRPEGMTNQAYPVNRSPVNSNGKTIYEAGPYLNL